MSVCLSVFLPVCHALRQVDRQGGNCGLNYEFVNCCEIKVKFKFSDVRSVLENPREPTINEVLVTMA